ncbi:MAG TPA: hypothetical protein ACQGQI_05180 [Xylella sp.]
MGGGLLERQGVEVEFSALELAELDRHPLTPDIGDRQPVAQGLVRDSEGH